MVNIYFSVISGKNLPAREKRSFKKYPQEEKVSKNQFLALIIDTPEILPLIKKILFKQILVIDKTVIVVDNEIKLFSRIWTVFKIYIFNQLNLLLIIFNQLSLFWCFSVYYNFTSYIYFVLTIIIVFVLLLRHDVSYEFCKVTYIEKRKIQQRISSNGLKM